MDLLPADAKQALKLFRRQYLQLWDQKLLSFPIAEHLSNSTFQSLLYSTIYKPGALAYPPPERYQLRVLKELIARIESILDPDEDEASEDLLLCLSNLLASPLPLEAISVQQKSYVTYTITGNAKSGEDTNLPDHEHQVVTLLESRSVVTSSGTTGFRTWEAALHLGSYLVRSTEGAQLIKDKNVLELGAGTGFLSILCAKRLSARRVLATDGAPAVVKALETNFFLNGLDTSGEKMSSSILKWGWALPGKVMDSAEGVDGWDVVLGADVTYDATANMYLVSTLRDLFDKFPSIVAVISPTIRNEDTLQVFIQACETNKFIIQEVAFKPLPVEEQQGPFYATVMPSRILSITRSNPGEDTWAI